MVTRKLLINVADLINVELGVSLECWTFKGEARVSTKGHHFVSRENEAWLFSCITDENGRDEQIFYAKSPRELFVKMSAYREGVRRMKQVIRERGE